MSILNKELGISNDPGGKRIKKMRKEIDVAVIGNIGIDTNVYLYGNEIDYAVEANFTQNIDTIGQAGAYATRAYAGLGFKTAFIGTVGQDVWGNEICRVLQENEIDVRGLWIDHEGTSRSVNIVNNNGLRKNFYDGKGHMQLKPPIGQCKNVLKGVKLVHFNIPNWARELLPIAKDSGKRIACDLQDMIDLNDPYRQDFVRSADYLFFSATNFSDVNELVLEMHRKAPSAVLICGMGIKGCMAYVNDRLQYFPPFIPSRKIVDTNGAGDTLAAVFLCQFELNHRNVEESIALAQKAAGLICTMRADEKATFSSEAWRSLLL